jgi:hypothetical protein
MRFYCFFVLIFLVLLPNSAICQQKSDESPCARIVTLIITQFIADIPITDLPRVEVRQCSEGELQIVAWAQKSLIPSLVVDTTDFTIVQLAARENVFMIETTGGPRNIVHVITYKNGTPILALKSVTKGTADVTVSRSSLKLSIPNVIYPGQGEPQIQMHKFELSLSDLFKQQ